MQKEAKPLFTPPINNLAWGLFLGFFTITLAISSPPLSTNGPKEEEEAEDREAMREAYYREELEKIIDPKLGYVPLERLALAYERAQTQVRKTSNANVGLVWTERGPTNIGGRTRTLLVDKNDPTNKKVWAGSVGGGLWYTNDITVASPVWQSVNDFFSNIAITTLAQHPTNTQIMYFGTGEGRGNADAIRGLGIYKSSDGGATWAQLPATNNSNFYYVQKIVIANAGIFAATNAGVYKSGDAGASWTRVLGTTTSPASGSNTISDIEVQADGSILAGINTGQIWRSVAATHGNNTGNAGTWTNVSPTGSFRRTEIAPAPSDAAVVYAMAQNSSNNDCNNIFMSSDSGKTWQSLTIPTIYDQGSNSNFTRGQAWYDLIIGVSPTDANTVYIGGVDILRSTDAGNTWTQISTWSSYDAGSAPTPWPRTYVHADIHELIFMGNDPSKLLMGTDGGVFYSANANAPLATSTPSASNKNTGYNVTQYYAADIDPLGCSNGILAGAQDNGTQLLRNSGLSTGSSVSGGDGMFCHIDQNNRNVQISSYVYNNYYYTTNYWSSSRSHRINNSGRFVNPTDFDDSNNVLYACNGSGSYLIIMGGVLNGSGTTLPTYYTRTGLTGTPAALKVDPNNSNTLWVGSTTGTLHRIRQPADSTPTVTRLLTIGYFGGYISSIDVQRGDSNHILVTVSNYGVAHVYESKNGGTSFTNISGNLPDMPVRWGLFNPLNPDQIFLGTEVGVWSCDDINGSSTQWFADNMGLANVRVDMLSYRTSDYTLVAATHGRGVYTAPLSQLSPLNNGFVFAEQDSESGQGYLGPNQSLTFYSATDGQILATLQNNTNFDYGCTTLEIARASQTNLTPQPFYSVEASKAILPKTFRILPQNNTANSNVTITLYYNQAEVTAWQTYTSLNWTNAQIIHCSGNINAVSPTSTQGGGTVTVLNNIGTTAAGLYSISATLTSGALSSWGVGVPGSILPLDLLSFYGEQRDNKAYLSWQTANEKAVKGFYVEQSNDGQMFKTLGFVQASNKTSGNNYQFTTPLSGQTPQYFRLKMVDLDASERYSKTVVLVANKEEQTPIAVRGNPFTDVLEIDLAAQTTAQGGRIYVFDATGRLVLSEVIPIGQNASMRLNMAYLAKGSYILQYQGPQNTIYNTKIIKF